MGLEVPTNCVEPATSNSPLSPALDVQRASTSVSLANTTALSNSTFAARRRTNAEQPGAAMSYYFAVVGTQDNPLFEYEFGSSKQGGDGQSRFTDQVRHLNQFILHSSLDIAEEVQWSHGQMCVLCPFLSFKS